jgi:hypothetical protein
MRRLLSYSVSRFPQPSVSSLEHHKGEHPGYPFRRYYWRGSVGICGPLLIALYYFITWKLYLHYPQSWDGTTTGRAGANLVFYSWFLIAVVGLDISEYGLVGAEASMLMKSIWAAPNALHIMKHGEHTWTGLGGWMSTLKSLLSRHELSVAPTRLWSLLMTVTLFVFIGLPLSGLTMELQDGFQRSNAIPQVIGQRWETFNKRSTFDTLSAGSYSWSLAVPPRVPGRGVIYVNKSVDMSDPTVYGLGQLPNTVPTDAGVNNIFLAPQAETPISGKAWGLMVRYNCTTIQKLEDFTILSRRNSSKPLSAAGIQLYNVDDQYRIEVRNRTVRQPFDQTLVNYQAISELGYSTESYGSIVDIDETAQQCYFNQTANATDGYPGLETEQILEVALWQYITDHNALIDPPLPADFFNFTIDTLVAGLDGAYSLPNATAPNSSVPLSAIGVQCRSSSALGFADIDGTTSTYQNFEKGDTQIVSGKYACPLRVSQMVPGLVFQGSFNGFADQSKQTSWADDFFTSAEAQQAFLTNESGDLVVWLTVRPTLLQASDLRRSLLRAYGSAAVQLMYNGGQGYSFAQIGDRYRFANPNATAFIANRVLIPGPLPAVVPAVLFVLWCIGCASLSIAYGFDLRWADTLDSYSLFRFGADMGAKVQEKQAFAVPDADECEELQRLPGLIGDSKPYFNPGHVTLVEETEARKKKYYT